jgi:hypothetical protein
MGEAGRFGTPIRPPVRRGVRPRSGGSHSTAGKEDDSMQGKMKHDHYLRLLGMTALSFVSMYTLMYAMVDSASSIYNNFTRSTWPA